MPPPPAKKYREQLQQGVVVRAVTSPTSLCLATTALLLLITPPTALFGAGILAVDAVWVWSRLRSPTFSNAVADELARHRWWRLINRLEETTAEMDPATAASLRCIVHAQERLFALYGSHSGLMPATRTELTSLLEHCLSLAQKRRRVCEYLADFRPGDVQREATQLQNQADAAHDGVTSTLYQSAADLKRRELENYLRLGDAAARIDGQLTAVRCTFDSMLSNLVRMQTLDGVDGVAEHDPVAAEIAQLKHGVEALETSLSEMLTLRAAS